MSALSIMSIEMESAKASLSAEDRIALRELLDWLEERARLRVYDRIWHPWRPDEARDAERWAEILNRLLS